jgi:hypothetical protein
MELRWTEEGRECAARFQTEAEARQCAALLGSRQEVLDVQLLDEDGVNLAAAPEQSTGIEFFR